MFAFRSGCGILLFVTAIGQMPGQVAVKPRPGFPARNDQYGAFRPDDSLGRINPAGPRDWAPTVVFSPDGKTLAMWGSDQRIHLAAKVEKGTL